MEQEQGPSAQQDQEGGESDAGDGKEVDDYVSDGAGGRVKVGSHHEHDYKCKGGYDWEYCW